MCSRGSVIPLFVSQIKQNIELTVTNPQMTRFMMSLNESVNLVINAFENGESGDIFVQKSPACTIWDLAKALSEIFNSNSEIRIIGTRHAEKLYESLISQQEMARVFEDDNFYKIPPDDRDLNYADYFTVGNSMTAEKEAYTSHNTNRLNKDEIKELLLNDNFIKRNLQSQIFVE